jgi:hypothetical protein
MMPLNTSPRAVVLRLDDRDGTALAFKRGGQIGYHLTVSNTAEVALQEEILDDAMHRFVLPGTDNSVAWWREERYVLKQRSSLDLEHMCITTGSIRQYGVAGDVEVRCTRNLEAPVILEKSENPNDVYYHATLFKEKPLTPGDNLIFMPVRIMYRPDTDRLMVTGLHGPDEFHFTLSGGYKIDAGESQPQRAITEGWPSYGLRRGEFNVVGGGFSGEANRPLYRSSRANHQRSIRDAAMYSTMLLAQLYEAFHKGANVTPAAKEQVMQSVKAHLQSNGYMI